MNITNVEMLVAKKIGETYPEDYRYLLEEAAFVGEYHPGMKGKPDVEIEAALADMLVGTFGGRCFVTPRNLHDALGEAATAALAAGDSRVRHHEGVTDRCEVAFSMCVNIRPKTIREVYEVIYARLEEKGLLPDEHFSLWSGIDPNLPFPDGRWVASYAVRGGSEGVWLHVGVVVQPTAEVRAADLGAIRKALREKGISEAQVELAIEQIGKLELVRSEKIIHLFGGKSLLEGREGMEKIYLAAAEIAKMMA